MNSVFTFMTSPTTQDVILTYLALQLYSALVQSLPTPQEYGGIWYRSVYNFLSILGNDFKSFIASKIPDTAAVTVQNGTKSVTSTRTVTGSDVAGR